MAFASTDRMDGVAGGYARPSVRGTAARGVAEGFDRILNAAGAREPQAAARKAGLERAGDRTGGPQARTPARADEAASSPRRDAPAPPRTGSRDDAGSATDTGPKIRASDAPEPPAEKPDAAADVAEPRVPAEDAAAEPTGGTAAGPGEAGAAGPDGRATAAQPAPVPQGPAETQAVQVGAAQVQFGAEVAKAAGAATSETIADATEETDGEGEEAGADPAAPPALPAFLALLAVPPSKVPAGAGTDAAAGQIGGVPGTTGQAGGAAGAAAGAVLAPLPGQVLEGAQAASASAASGTAEALAAEAGTVRGAEAGAKASAVPTDTGAAKEAGAKPDLVAALAAAMAEPGSAAPGQGLVQAAAQGMGQGPGQALGQTGPAHAAAQAAGNAAIPTTPPVQIGQVPMTIGLRALSGSSQFEIRLDPLELGRIDVKLEIDKERGTVMTHMVVERVETLAMLQRDAGSLQQALSQAGLDAQEGGINLSLRGDGQAGDRTGDQAGGQDGRAPRGAWVPEPERAAEVPLRILGGLGGLDIRI